PVMAWEVSTLPATTAAGGSGASMDPGGTTIVRGRRHPSLRGMSSATRVRKTYRTAALTTANGALKLVDSWADVPVKSTVAERWARSTPTRTRMTAPESVS